LLSVFDLIGQSQRAAPLALALREGQERPAKEIVDFNKARARPNAITIGQVPAPEATQKCSC